MVSSSARPNHALQRTGRAFSSLPYSALVFALPVAELEIVRHYATRPMNDQMPPMLVQLLQRELAPGECVLWQGRPSLLTRVWTSVGTLFFGVVFLTVFFGTWAVSRSVDGRQVPSPDAGWDFFHIIFFLLGASMLAAPLWAWWVARRTIYAVTDRRAIIIEAPHQRTIYSFADERLASFVRRESWRGRGDIIFEQKVTTGPKGRTTIHEVGFFGLPDVRRIEQLLRTTHTQLSRA